MSALVGVILAGGLARRMGGGDKGLLDLGGRTILSRVIGRMSPQVAALALNANGDPARFADYRLPVISDSVEGKPGPLAGILAGMDWAAAADARWLVTAAADTPFLPADLATRLIARQAQTGAPIVLAATRADDGRMLPQPTFGLWSPALREDLRAALAAGTRKVIAWTDPLGAARAEFPTTPIDPFFNVNRPADLDAARDMLAGAGK